MNADSNCTVWNSLADNSYFPREEMLLLLDAHTTHICRSLTVFSFRCNVFLPVSSFASACLRCQKSWFKEYKRHQRERITNDKHKLQVRHTNHCRISVVKKLNYPFSAASFRNPTVTSYLCKQPIFWSREQNQGENTRINQISWHCPCLSARYSTAFL